MSFVAEEICRRPRLNQSNKLAEGEMKHPTKKAKKPQKSFPKFLRPNCCNSEVRISLANFQVGIQQSFIQVNFK